MRRNKAEEDFADLFKEVELASFSQDVNEHWDLSIDGLRVDVKGIKRVSRSGSLDDQFHWIELKNVRGRDGWLYGKADFIAFETTNHWVLVDRLVLIDFIEAKVEDVFVDFPLYKKKTRKGRKDIITLVLTADLEKIGIKINKNVLKQDPISGETTGETKLRSWHVVYLFIRQGKRLSNSLFSEWD